MEKQKQIEILNEILQTKNINLGKYNFDKISEIIESIKKEVMKKRKRPCEVSTTKWIPNEESPNGRAYNKKMQFNGLFHEWGQEAVEDNGQGFGNFTVGIVEDENGQVHTVNPNHVKFLDK